MCRYGWPRAERASKERKQFEDIPKKASYCELAGNLPMGVALWKGPFSLLAGCLWGGRTETCWCWALLGVPQSSGNCMLQVRGGKS